MPRGDDDDLLHLPPLPPLGSDESLGTGDGELVLDIDPAAGEIVGLDDAEAGLGELDPAVLLDELEELAPDDGSLAPGVELDLAEDIPASDAEYGHRDGTEAPSAEEWEGDHGITTLAELGSDDGGETGLDDLAMGLQGDDALPSLPPLEGDAEEGEPLADDLDLGDVMAVELPETRDPASEPDDVA
ncbi:MAG: hypothetical protein JJ863_19505 [Deltaproteobacteria bacterium]|nr:hypothetical protein [Deltaproteobacteria bacterium]